MNTVPGGTPSCGSSPARPLVATATSASNSRHTPVAISDAARSLRIELAVTPSTSRLIRSW
jgi:hypothetical protein